MDPILFVGDTDAIRIDMNKQQSAIEVHRDMQESIASWGSLLMASWGAFNQIKFCYYQISFNWNTNGKPSYAADEKDEGFTIGATTSGECFQGD